MTRQFILNIRQLRWLAVILPILFWTGTLYLRSLLFHENRTLEGDLFALAAIAVGAALFSVWIFRTIEEREAEIKRRSEQLTALHGAAIALTTELDLSTVLQKVVDLSRDLVGARYGALGVLQEDGQFIEQFITVGITPEQRAALGALRADTACSARSFAKARRFGFQVLLPMGGRSGFLQIIPR